MRTLVVAEPGSTHEGDFDTMLHLIDVAFYAGCDVFKNQWTSSAATMCARRHAPEYLESYLKLQYPGIWHERLRAACRERGLEYACTAYIPGDAKVLAPFVDYLKISSFECTDQELLDEAMDSGSLVIVSTGMATDYTPVLTRPGRPKMPWAVLHCCSSYPAPLSDLNLDALAADLRPAKLGFSDHSRDVRVGAWAICVGAEIIETHFRLDDCDPSNNDYEVAFTPAELSEYVRNIRAAEGALGDGIKRIQPCEAESLRFRVTS